MKVSVRPLRSRADELMMSPFRRIEVGAMVGARGAIIMVWSEVIQLAKSDVRARRGVQRPTVLRCWAHVNLFKMRVLRRGGPCSTRTASPAACRLPPRPARVAVGLGAAVRSPKLSLSACRCRGPLYLSTLGREYIVVYIVLLGSVISRGPGGNLPGTAFRALPTRSRLLKTGFVRFAHCGSFPRRRAPPARPRPEARSRTAAARARGPRPEAQAEPPGSSRGGGGGRRSIAAHRPRPRGCAGPPRAPPRRRPGRGRSRHACSPKRARRERIYKY